MIAWGGVLFQAILLAVVIALRPWVFAWSHDSDIGLLKLVVGQASGVVWRSGFVIDPLAALTGTNVLIMVLNLLPMPPLDGAEAWKLPSLLKRRWRTATSRPS